MRKKRLNRKKFLRLVLIAIILVLLTTVGFKLTSYFADKREQQSFVQLDTQMRLLFDDLKSASDQADDWQYRAGCEPQLSGPWPTGKYNCDVVASLQVEVSSPSTADNLHTRYSKIVNAHKNLHSISEPVYTLPNDFGKNFVISTVERTYTETGSGLECRYLAKLGQSSEKPHLNYVQNYSHGSPIDGDVGKLTIQLNCGGLASKNWL